MKTLIEKIQQDDNDLSIYKKAARIIRQGGLVAFPTETVYGLGANGMNEQAAFKIYEAKGRPSDNPLILHIADQEQLNEIVKEIPSSAKKLMDTFWPGPLTLIFKKSDQVPYGATGGLDTVAVRMPSHPAAVCFLKETGLAVAAPSANISGRPSPTLASHVVEDLNGKVDMILDGGAVGIGIESAIVDMTVSPPMILRPGCITWEMLESTLGEPVAIDQAIITSNKELVHPKAPGMKYRHYAPVAELTIIEGNPEDSAKEIVRLVQKKKEEGYTAGILGTKECEAYYQGELYKILGSRDNEESIAHNLYKILREYDHMAVDFLYAEGIPEDQLGIAIMNRLAKAAGQHIIKV